MLGALNDGFHVVLYSRTHKYLPKVLHKSLGVRLVLGNGMNLIFNGHLIHGGGKGRINDEGILSEDKRIFITYGTHQVDARRKMDVTSTVLIYLCVVVIIMTTISVMLVIMITSQFLI